MRSVKLTWFELHPPHGVELAALTPVIRPLMSRGQVGFIRRTPLVAFELWSISGKLHWLTGMDHRLDTTLPQQMKAQLRELVLTEVANPSRLRPPLDVAGRIRVTGIAQQIRLEVATAISAGVLDTLAALAPDEAGCVQVLVGPSQGRKEQPRLFNIVESLGIRPFTMPTTREQTMWRQKTVEPLFGVRVRVGATAATRQRAEIIVKLLGDALMLASASHTALTLDAASGSASSSLVSSIEAVTASGHQWSMLSAAEVATLLGWPLEGVVVPGVRSGINPAPASLLVPSRRTARIRQARVLGKSLHPADGSQLVTLPVETSLHHVHVIGATGSGKSTLLAQMVRSDMQAGRGCLVIEPRGDLVADVLAGVPEGRRDDVVVIDPGRSDLVVGINPLSGPLKEAERRADEVLHLFKELYPNLGPRSTDVLLHVLIALARSPQGTLADIPMVLSNSRFRRQVLGEVGDPLVLGPFFAWYEALSDAERAKVVAPVLNKTRAFITRTSVRRMLGQPVPAFQLDELFTKRRIVLVNLNEGIIGPETASLIGALLVSQLWQATQRRASLPQRLRHPVMVVCDEVQRFLKLPVDISDMLAQCRGLGVSVTAAHQHLGQLDEKLKGAFLANARTKIMFKPSSHDHEPLAKATDGALKPGDFGQLGAHEAYVQCLVDRKAEKPFGVGTLKLGSAVSDAAMLRRRSEQRHGTDGEGVDKILVQRWGVLDRPRRESVGVRRPAV